MSLKHEERLAAIASEIRDLERHQEDLWSILADEIGENAMGWLAEYVKTSIVLALAEKEWEEATK